MKERLVKTRLMNNYGLKLLALLIAALLWLIVVNVDDPITAKVYSGIPVKVINEDVVTDNNRTYQILDETEEVSVTIRARRSVLKKIRTDDIVARADMKEMILGTQIPIEVVVDGYMGRIEEITSKPGNLQVSIDEEAKTTLPITPTATGTLREGSSIQSLVADPVQATFRGPKSLIENIKRVSALVDVSGLSTSTQLEGKLILYDNYENVIDQTMIENNLGKEGVTVEVILNQIKSVPVVADTSMINTETGYTLDEVTVAPSEINIVGARTDLAEISEIKIPASAMELYNVNQKQETTIDIRPYLPDSVNLQDENANMVVITVSVNQPGAESYDVSTNSIDIQNLDKNLNCDFGSIVDVEIQVRGPEETLSKFSPTKRVTLNLKRYKRPGKYKVPLTVDLPKDCTLVNKVYVSVTLEKKTSENETDSQD